MPAKRHGLRHCRAYGGRGIVIAPRWDVFENFLADMGHPPVGLTLDRIDVDGDYSPENCRWATRKQQSRNRRGRTLLTVHGETHCLSEWAERRGLNSRTVRSRLRYGWTHEEALGFAPRRVGGQQKDLTQIGLILAEPVAVSA